jgi:methylenetetrahydrofolate reductase (NADPH)
MAGRPEEGARPLAALLQTYSVEVTSRDTKSLAEVREIMPAGGEVFVANLPRESADVLVSACAEIKEAGLTPVPHVVARNIATRADLDDMLRRLVSEAGVERALVLGGDRDDPAGEFESALQLLETGLFEKHGIRKVYISSYPEGHPRIADEVLEQARADKLAAAEKAGLEVTLVGQFLFESQPIIDLARRLRAAGIKAPFRVGVAGPTDRTKLLKYALRCGVGASLRALKERGDLARNVMSGETPEDLLSDVAAAAAADPSLGIEGVHFFTFGNPAGSVRWAEAQK